MNDLLNNKTMLIAVIAFITLLLLLFIILLIRSILKKDKSEDESKKEKKEKEEIIKLTTEVMPIRYYDEDIGCFVLEDKSCLDIPEVVPSDRGNLQDDEMQYNIITNTRFYRLYSPDIKFISMNFPVNTSRQRELLTKKLKKTHDEVRKLWLEREIEELDILDKNIMRSEYYMMYFGNDREDFIKNKNGVLRSVGYGRSRLVKEITKEKKIQIMKKLNNINSLILPNDLTEQVSDDEE